jgi:hypothetical protein
MSVVLVLTAAESLSLGSGAKVFCREFSPLQPELETSRLIARQLNNNDLQG